MSGHSQQAGRWLAVVTALVLTACAGWQSNPPSLGDAVAATIQEYKERDPGIEKYFEDAWGYVVFPSVSKGALAIGMARGQGQVFLRGKLVATAVMTQVTVGVQLGGQKFSEVIFFKKAEIFEAFTRNEYSANAQATVVFLKTGCAAATSYHKDVAIFIYSRSGLMVEVSFGEQSFEIERV